VLPRHPDQSPPAPPAQPAGIPERSFPRLLISSRGRADLIAGTVLWLVALAAAVLIFSKKSNPYYRREPVQR